MNYFDLDDLEGQGLFKSIRKGSPFENGTLWQITRESYVSDSDDKSESKKVHPVFKAQRVLKDGMLGGEQNLFLASFLKPKYDFKKDGKQVQVPADKGRLTLEFASLYDAAASDKEFFEMVFRKYGKPFQIRFDRTVKFEQAKWDNEKSQWSKTESYPSSLVLFDLEPEAKQNQTTSKKKQSLKKRVRGLCPLTLFFK